MTFTREVSWGDALALEMFKTPGGLKNVVDAIDSVLGPHYGTRNTFAKLLKIDDPEQLGLKDQWRAWLLLTALGHDPGEWSLPPDMTPPYMDRYDLATDLQEAVRRQGLEPRTRCVRNFAPVYALPSAA
jgi:hypothetical protein